MIKFTSHFKVSVNFKVENQREKFIIVNNILYPIYNILTKKPISFMFSSWIVNEYSKKTHENKVRNKHGNTKTHEVRYYPKLYN